MALHLRLLNKNTLCSPSIKYRLYSGTIDIVRHADGDNESSVKCHPAQESLASSICEYAQAPLQSLVHGSFRLRDTMCDNLLKAKQVFLCENKNGSEHMSMTSLKVLDTSLLDPDRLPISRDHHNSLPVISYKSQRQSSNCDELFSHLIDSNLAQQYVCNSDDIVFNQSNPEVESTQLIFDRSLMDKHFNLQSTSSISYQSIVNLLQEHEEKCNAINEELLEAYLRDHDPHGLQYGMTEEVFDRYDDDRNTEFPAFHKDINTPQFAGAVSVPNTSKLASCKESSSPLECKHTVNMSNTDSKVPEQPKPINPITGEQPDPSKFQEKPGIDILMKFQEYAVEKMPKFMVEKHDYRIYRPDLYYENNYNPQKPRIIKEIGWYVVEVFKIRGWSAAKYVNTNIKILKATSHEDEGVVRIHWQFRGLPQLEILKVWNFVPWKYKNSITNESEYYEGISTFHLDGNGSVFRHIVERTLPIQEAAVKKSLRMRIREKMRSYIPAPVLGGSSATYKKK